MLAIKELKQDGKYEVQNYDELKQEVVNIVNPYKTLVVDENNLPSAKSDIAKLNKVSKILNDTRIKAQKEYLEPFMYGKGQFDELIGIINEATTNLKTQIDEIEEKRKYEKRNQILPIFEKVYGELLRLIQLDKIFNERWYNKTYSIESIETEITESKNVIDKDIEVLKGLTNSEDKQLNIIAIYFNTLDLATTIKDYKELEYRKEIIKNLWHK